jgi:hypothetical protein
MIRSSIALLASAEMLAACMTPVTPDDTVGAIALPGTIPSGLTANGQSERNGWPVKRPAARLGRAACSALTSAFNRIRMQVRRASRRMTASDDACFRQTLMANLAS